MKKTRFTEEQMVTILREADTKPVPDVAKKHGVSGQTIYSWRKHFGSLEPSDVKRLRQLEQENGRLKKMVADRDLEIDVLKEITRKNGGARVRRQQVAYTRSRGLSDRRACAVLSVARSTLGYQSRLAVRDAPALAAMRRLAAQYPRYGYRRIRIFLRREGHVMSPDRAHRLWRHAGLQVPRRRPRRRVATGRPRPLPPTARNHVWAYDFVFDTCANRQTLKCLTIVDEWTRECLAIDVAGGIRSGRVIEVRAQLVSVHGAPRHLRSACYEQVVKALGAVGESNRGTDTGSGSVEPAHRASSGLIPEERRVPGGRTSSCLRCEGLRTTVGMASSPAGTGASGSLRGDRFVPPYMVSVERRAVLDDGERIVQQFGHAGPDRLHWGQGTCRTLCQALVVGFESPVMADR